MISIVKDQVCEYWVHKGQLVLVVKKKKKRNIVHFDWTLVNTRDIGRKKSILLPLTIMIIGRIWRWPLQHIVDGSTVRIDPQHLSAHSWGACATPAKPHNQTPSIIWWQAGGVVEVRLWERNKRELVVIVLDPSSYTDTPWIAGGFGWCGITNRERSLPSVGIFV